MGRFQHHTKRLRNLLLVLLVLSWQVVFAGAPIFQSHMAHAAPPCITDTAGANDVPGQKDLTKLCVDYAGSPNTVATIWNWDETGTSGANTLDACNLFDTDGDGNANYAVCVTTTGDPATFQATTTYSCGDARDDRCTSQNPVIPNGTTTCNVSQQNTDPFPSGASNPVDTQGACTIQLAAVGGATATLIDVCSYPSAQPNSDPSDCVIAQPKAGKLEVVKHLLPTTDSGLFNLQINSVTKAANVGNNGTTGEIVESAGNNGTSYAVSETAGTNTSLASYDTAIVCKDLNGTGNTIASSSTTSANVTVVDGADIVCVITNTLKQATLILQKTVTNNNGGTLTQSNFPVAIGVNTAQWGSNTVSPGTYTVSETQQTGYQASAWGTDCTAGGSVTLLPGQTKTCSITNDDIAPQLTVIKHVVNNNGGTAVASSFTMNLTGTNVSSSSFAGSESPGTTVTLNAGSYSVDEGATIGYGKTLSADCSGTIAIGESKTCTITNDDIAPSLTVTKVVVNPYGTPLDPSAFPLFVDGISVTSGVANTNFSAGSHVVTETQQTGYTLTNVTGNCSQDQQGTIGLTLSVGGSATCTLTNTAIQPKVIVIKHVINDNGGTKTAADFTMTVTGNSATVPNFAGAESPGTTVPLNEGNYVVDETSHVGYTESRSADCTSTVSVGQTKTCTITNDDIAPSLTLNKIVSNTHGGTAIESNWTLTATGLTNLSGPGAAGNADVVSGATFSAGDYTLSEASNAPVSATGYSASAWTCTNGVTVINNQMITLANGQTTVCSITNSDVAPQLTVIKHVINDNSGNSSASDFTMNVTGTNVSNSSFAGAEDPGTTVTLNAGSYSVDETQTDGYTKSFSGDCDSTIAIGQTKTCTITNNDIAHPSIGIQKYGPDTAFEGDTVTYTFVVTNTGDTVLEGATVNDNIAGGAVYQSGDVNTNDKLDLTEVWVYTKDYVIPAGQTDDVVNTATACAYYIETKVCNEDSHTLDVVHPSIHVVKSGPSSAQAGQTVTYTFTVTNTGDVPLSGLTAQDNVAGNGVYQSGDVNNNQMLDVNETWIYTVQYTIPANQFDSVVNTVTVCGVYDNTFGNELRIDSVEGGVSQQICDQDSHTLTIPKVLAETTTLVNTGQGAYAAIVAGTAILIGLFNVTYFSFKKSN